MIGFKELKFATLNGRLIDLNHPQPEDFNPLEIAHCLSIINRFAGNTLLPISVAQHVCMVAERVPMEFRLHALHHDSHEMITSDIPRPVKEWLGDNIKFLENSIDHAIFKRFGIKPTAESYASIERAESQVLAMEFRDFRPNGWQMIKEFGLEKPGVHQRKINPLGWEQAKQKLIEMYLTV